MTTNRNTIRHSWWRIGILLVALFLSHDLLMAMPAQAASQHPEMGHHGAASAVDAASSPENPSHPLDCGATSPAVTVFTTQPEYSSGLALPLVAPSICVLLAQDLEFRWQEPAWPPGLRRALLQVFRL